MKERRAERKEEGRVGGRGGGRTRLAFLLGLDHQNHIFSEADFLYFYF